jgi:hypothetical protein
VLAQASISKLGFGVYTMIQDPLSQTVMGYFEAEILYVVMIFCDDRKNEHLLLT